ncbi:MAG: ATP-binding protein [Eubacterium sp.]
MKEKKKRSSKNLKINTRIVISTVMAVVIPLIVIAIASPLLISTTPSFFNFSTVTTNSYSTINQIQWSQTVSAITNELIGDGSEEEKLKKTQEFVAPLEELNSLICIEKNGEDFYSSEKSSDILDVADSLVNVEDGKNINYFSDDGLVIVNHIDTGGEKYRIIIVNDDYTASGASDRISIREFRNLLLGRTGIIVLIIVLLFVAAIAILSFITTKTIVSPIKKIEKGADEIARGNLNYKIEYKSTNELGKMVDSFNKMRLRLKQSIEKQNEEEEKRKELVAGIAHDLRTPLTSAKGYAEGLRDGIADSPEKQKRYIKTICSSIDDTERILNDLLDVSRMEINGYRLNKTDVNAGEFFGDCADEIGVILEKAGFDFSFEINCDKDAEISVDIDRFVRVINNIISNCIKYAREDVKGRVQMTLNDYDKSVILEVSDNGIGVDRESLPKIFDTMFRADPARSKVSEGSGLGLAVCKQIVELHGGFIWASSREEEGLSIFISLPKKEVLK